MDHIPLPQRPQRPPIVVQVLNTEDYDGGDLSTYPEREGWGPRPIQGWHDIFQRPTRHFLEFLERWLYFGFLSTMLKTPIKTSDFIRYEESPSFPVLTTERLPSLLLGWTKRVDFCNERLGVLSPAMLSLHMHQSLLSINAEERLEPETLSQIESLVQYMSLTRIKDVRSPEMAMAMSVLLETVFISINQEFFTLDPWVLSRVLASRKWHSRSWTLLREDGWCPSELVTQFNRLNTSSLYFLHNLSRPGLHETHSMIRIRASSETADNTVIESRPPSKLCTAFRCSAKKLPNDTYRTKHAEGCTGCDEAVADQDELYTILKRRKVPLIMSVDEMDEGEAIMLVEAEPGMSYVAISHVWSDGLGNLERNAIPRCQLKRLSKLIRSLSGDYVNIILFWLDTICVPPDAAGSDECQQIALGMMRDVYQDATTVLVLDSWLLSIEHSDMKHEEILMRIFSCTWNSRLWTFQEGALPKALHFQFGDGAYDLDDGMRCIRDSEDFCIKITFKPVLEESYYDIRGFRKLELGGKVLAISGALSGRATSVASDEAICMSILLDLDVEKIVRTEPHLRMEELWRMLPVVPMEILQSDLETLDVEGLRWAPRTFLRSESNMAHDGTPLKSKFALINMILPVPCTSRGLDINAQGLRFVSKFAAISEHFIVGDENGQWYDIQIAARINRDAAPYQYHEDGRPKMWYLRPGEVYGSQELAFIEGNITDNIFRDVPLHLRPTRTALEVSGFLVAITLDEGNIIYGRKICWAMSRRLSPIDTDRIATLETVRARGLHYGGNLGLRESGTLVILYCLVGKKTPSRQQWCIG